jgi:hypothetical protein
MTAVAAPSERPVTLYLFAMLGCEYCEKAKTEIVPKLQEAGAFVVTIFDVFEQHRICGWRPKMYPSWLFTAGGRKIEVVEGLVPAKRLLASYAAARAG